MTRIQPECFIEFCKLPNGEVKQYSFWVVDNWNPESVSSESTIAIFLIKPQYKNLAERLEARKANNHLNP
jgi:hypothetical protein